MITSAFICPVPKILAPLHMKKVKKPLCPGKGRAALVPVQTRGTRGPSRRHSWVKAKQTQPQTHTSNNASSSPFYSSQISSFSNSEVLPKGPGYFLPDQPHFHGNGPRLDAVITAEKHLCIQNFPAKKNNKFTNKRHDEHSLRHGFFCLE